MSDTSTEKEFKIELIKIKEEGDTNNYGEFKAKAKLKLLDLELWKYIDGPSSVPPAIPALVKRKDIEARDAQTGVMRTVTDSYFIVFVDCCSRYIFVFFLKHKSDSLENFKTLQAAVERFLSQKIAILRLDNASELVQGLFKSYCDSTGIQYEKTVPESPQQNGVAERTIGILSSMARSMLLNADLSDFFSPLAILAASHIKNRVPHASTLPKTPFEFWHRRKPDLSHLRPFGTPVTSRILNAKSLTKFDARGESGRFVGYARDAKGYLIWFPAKRAVRVRRDLVFHDFPVPAPVQHTNIDRMWPEVYMENESRLTDNEPLLLEHSIQVDRMPNGMAEYADQSANTYVFTSYANGA